VSGLNQFPAKKPYGQKPVPLVQIQHAPPQKHKGT